MIKVNNGKKEARKKSNHIMISFILKSLVIIFVVFLCYYVSCIFLNNNKSSAGKNIKTDGFFDIGGMLKDLTTIETIDGGLKGFDVIDKK